MVQLVYTIYISVDLVHYGMVRDKVKTGVMNQRMYG